MEKRFTISEANDLLPRLKEDLVHLQALAGHYEDEHRKLLSLRVREEARAGSGNGKEDRFFEAEGRLEFMRMELELLIGNFERKGVLLKMIHPGLIDFPAFIDGEDVLICWKEGEEQATHYHGWHDGFIGRKRLPGF